MKAQWKQLPIEMVVSIFDFLPSYMHRLMLTWNRTFYAQYRHLFHEQYDDSASTLVLKSFDPSCFDPRQSMTIEAPGKSFSQVRSIVVNYLLLLENIAEDFARYPHLTLFVLPSSRCFRLLFKGRADQQKRFTESAQNNLMKMNHVHSFENGAQEFVLSRDSRFQNQKLRDIHMVQLATLLGCSLETLLCLLNLETDFDLVFSLFQKSHVTLNALAGWIVLRNPKEAARKALKRLLDSKHFPIMQEQIQRHKQWRIIDSSTHLFHYDLLYHPDVITDRVIAKRALHIRNLQPAPSAEETLEFVHPVIWRRELFYEDGRLDKPCTPLLRDLFKRFVYLHHDSLFSISNEKKRLQDCIHLFQEILANPNPKEDWTIATKNDYRVHMVGVLFFIFGKNLHNVLRHCKDLHQATSWGRDIMGNIYKQCMDKGYQANIDFLQQHWD